MSGRYGAIAEGWINGVWVSSLGKAGVDKNGKLKDEACYSEEKAWMRALRVVANKGRFVIEGPDGWTNFPDLLKTTQQKLLEDASRAVEWEIVSPNLYRATINENLFQFSREGALA
jgi:hypothetical protein|tara:strand:- start:1260 stop:1607 length:348 start_codon:yes stop_codon:yes gene_type:complete